MRYLLIKANKYGVNNIEITDDVRDGVARFYDLAILKMHDVRPDISNDFMQARAEKIVLQKSYNNIAEVLRHNGLSKEFLYFCIDKINSPWKYYQTVYVNGIKGCKITIEEENDFTEIGLYELRD